MNIQGEMAAWYRTNDSNYREDIPDTEIVFQKEYCGKCNRLIKQGSDGCSIGAGGKMCLGCANAGQATSGFRASYS